MFKSLSAVLLLAALSGCSLWPFATDLSKASDEVVLQATESLCAQTGTYARIRLFSKDPQRMEALQAFCQEPVLVLPQEGR